MDYETLTCDLAGLSFTYPKNDPYVKTTAEQVILHDEYKLLELRQAGHWPRTIVDVGGNCGAFGLQALRIFPDARLLAYEPLKDLADLYVSNVLKNNPIRKVERHNHHDTPIHEDTFEVLPVACGLPAVKDAEMLYYGYDWPEQKTVTIHRTPGSPGSFLEGSWNPYDSKSDPLIDSYPVTKTSLVENLWTRRIQVIDVLKVDCEGSEADVFQDLLTGGWFPRIRWIRLEWHGMENLARLVNIFREAGTHEFHFDTAPGRNLGFGIAHHKFDA